MIWRPKARNLIRDTERILRTDPCPECGAWRCPDCQCLILNQHDHSPECPRSLRRFHA
jgi:hypothetical protein